ncbi:MAG: crossover junction endodeoxyribonuclease RuvC [Candidatus Zixiibacteriota bacterium]
MPSSFTSFDDMITKQTILAIDPGLRETGIAQFHGKELVDFGVKSLRRPGNAKSRTTFLCEIVARLLLERNPDVVAIEKNSFGHIPQNQPLMAAIERVKGLISEAKIPIWEFAPNTIKKEVTSDGRATKRQVANVLSAKFPELKAYREADRKWRERYYQNMFDAVACGLTYLKLYDEDRLK